MDNVKKIMVAMAFTSYSEDLFNCAAQLAQLLNAELIIASIINSRDISAVRMVASMGYEVDAEHYIEGVRAERKEMLEQIMAKSSFNPKVGLFPVYIPLVVGFGPHDFQLIIRNRAVAIIRKTITRNSQRT
jgi:hypothetical protein